MNLLTDHEFHATFCEPRTNVTGVEIPFDIWSYADVIIESDYSEYQDWNWRIECIYEMGYQQYHHILIPVPRDNCYLVLVLVDNMKQIYGHHILDMNQKYGLDDA